MSYIIFGLALGTLISGLIEKCNKNEATNWINPALLFLISGSFFLFFIYLEWFTIQKVFENLFS